MFSEEVSTNPLCHNYKNLSDISRHYAYGKGVPSYCDEITDDFHDKKDWMGTGIYRFVGIGTSTNNTQLSMTRMATKSETNVNGHICNTVAAGHIDSWGHPEVSDGETVSAKACFSYKGKYCWGGGSQNFSIEITNCGPFYVYNLTNAPHCYLRYCGA